MVPFDTQPDNAAEQTAVEVPPVTSLQTITLQAGVAAAESQKQVPSVPTAV